MPPTIDATVGGPYSNSYCTVVYANAYFDSRPALDPSWDSADSAEVQLVHATRLLDALAQPFKTLIPAQGGAYAYYRVRRQWTGGPATSTQRLAWPRWGMLDRNGNPIDPTILPTELLDATCELAGQLLAGDRTLDNDVIIQGLTSLRAGSVALAFKQQIMPQVIPDAVYNLLVQSWLTDELVIPAFPADITIL